MSHIVYVIQMKVALRLKLIVMVSLNIHVTSQDHMCVQCVTNGLQGKIT